MAWDRSAHGSKEIKLEHDRLRWKHLCFDLKHALAALPGGSLQQTVAVQSPANPLARACSQRTSA